MIKASDIVVLCSRSEGLGISLLEAMALKKPVIASRVGGIPEVINNGVTGFLVPPDDPIKLSKAIYHIICHKETARKIGEKAQESVKNKFLNDTMLKKTHSVLYCNSKS